MKPPIFDIYDVNVIIIAETNEDYEMRKNYFLAEYQKRFGKNFDVESIYQLRYSLLQNTSFINTLHSACDAFEESGTRIYISLMVDEEMFKNNRELNRYNEIVESNYLKKDDRCTVSYFSFEYGFGAACQKLLEKTI